MPKAYGVITERLLKLRPGGTHFVAVRRLSFKTLRKHAPQSDWAAESRDGGWVVTRVR